MKGPGQGDGPLPQSHCLLLTATLADGSEALDAWRRWCACFDLSSLNGEAFWVLPLLYRNLAKNNFQGPEKRRLAGVYRQQQLLKAIGLRCLPELTEALHSAGVRVLAGPVSFLCLAGRDDALPLDPIDLFVPAKEIETADRLLHSRGWIPLMPLPPPPLRPFVSQLVYDHAGAGRLYLGWRPFGPDKALSEDAGLWERSTTRSIGNTRLDVALVEDLLRMANRNYSNLKRIVLISRLAPGYDWRREATANQPLSDETAPLRVLIKRHWRRYQDCPAMVRPPGFARYLLAYHGYRWQTAGLRPWIIAAGRKIAGRGT